MLPSLSFPPVCRLWLGSGGGETSSSPVDSSGLASDIYTSLHVAAPKDATETVPVPGRTWPVTLDVVAKDETPSAAELNTLQHLTSVTPTVIIIVCRQLFTWTLVLKHCIDW